METSKLLAGQTAGEIQARDPQVAREARGEAVPCPNCGATLTGKFCQDCGQERRDRADLTVGRVIGGAARESVDLESGALGTLRDLLFRPGYLTVEYLEGRRRSHVAPAKLYILVSFVFFFFAWDRLMENAGVPLFFAPGGDFYPLIVERGLDVGVVAERFNGTFTEWTTWLRFGSVMLSGALLWLLYLGTRHLFAEHLVFSFHYFSFEFILDTAYTVGIMIFAAVSGREAPTWGNWLIFLIVIPYAFLALRRVYGESVPRVAAKTVGFIVGQYAIYFAVIIVAMFIALVVNGR